MPIPTDLASMNQNPALNGPSGNEPPSVLDNGLRIAYSGLAQLRDGVGFTVALGMPVKTSENSTGGVSIGYRTALSKFTIANGATVYTKWPIDISGKADTAAAADTATTATNANQFGGLAPIYWVRNHNAGNSIGFRWDAGSGYLINSVDGIEFGGVWPIRVNWANIISRPTDLASFTNSPGFATWQSVNDNFVARRDDVYAAGRAGNSGRLFFGGGELQWSGFIVSDAKYKTNVKPTAVDSLALLRQVKFVEFDFIESAPLAGGTHRRLGFIAQQAKSVDDTYVKDIEGTLYPDNEMLLYAALHAVAQAGDKIAALEARVVALEGVK